MSTNVIEIQDLSRKFGNETALQNVTLDIRQGGVLGLVGENGAGKTTLLKHTLGLFKAQQGSVRVFGLDPVLHPVEVLSQIGYLSENHDLVEWMRIGELLDYRRAFFSTWDTAYADELLQTFDLTRKQKIKTLSRGQHARVGLILALAHRPDLLILDEPSSGLDPVVRRDILGAIIRTVADEGRTVVFSSHLLDEVQRVADTIAMLHHGELVLVDELDDVLARHVRLTIRLPKPVDSLGQIPAIGCKGSGQEWTLLCNGGLAEVEQSLQALDAQVVERASPTLEEIFVARVHGT
jgi:ABC-2 type transport system ATP-binding protein